VLGIAAGAWLLQSDDQPIALSSLEAGSPIADANPAWIVKGIYDGPVGEPFARRDPQNPDRQLHQLVKTETLYAAPGFETASSELLVRYPVVGERAEWVARGDAVVAVLGFIPPASFDAETDRTQVRLIALGTFEDGSVSFVGNRAAESDRILAALGTIEDSDVGRLISLATENQQRIDAILSDTDYTAGPALSAVAAATRVPTEAELWHETDRRFRALQRGVAPDSVIDSYATRILFVDITPEAQTEGLIVATRNSEGVMTASEMTIPDFVDELFFVPGEKVEVFVTTDPWSDSGTVIGTLDVSDLRDNDVVTIRIETDRGGRYTLSHSARTMESFRASNG
jgi:hypothetical protein